MQKVSPRRVQQTEGAVILRLQFLLGSVSSSSSRKCIHGVSVVPEGFWVGGAIAAVFAPGKDWVVKLSLTLIESKMLAGVTIKIQCAASLGAKVRRSS